MTSIFMTFEIKKVNPVFYLLTLFFYKESCIYSIYLHVNVRASRSFLNWLFEQIVYLPIKESVKCVSGNV